MLFYIFIFWIFYEEKKKLPWGLIRHLNLDLNFNVIKNWSPLYSWIMFSCWLWSHRTFPSARSSHNPLISHLPPPLYEWPRAFESQLQIYPCLNPPSVVIRFIEISTHRTYPSLYQSPLLLNQIPNPMTLFSNALAKTHHTVPKVFVLSPCNQ